MTFVGKTIELATGVRLPFVEQGDPSGTPVLLLHGVTDSWRSFEPVLPYLPRSIHAIALTQRGHGGASRPESYRTRDFAADLSAFAVAFGLGPAVIVGHSMGSTNARRFAIDYPSRTLGLVLVSSFASYRGNPAVAEFWTSGVSQLTDPVDVTFVRGFQESTLAQPVPGAFLDTVVQESLKVPARVWRAAFEGFLEDDFVRELGQIKAPALILWGTRDSFCCRADQQALLEVIAGSRLIVYEGAGHALHWEEPKRFAEEIAAFVKAIIARNKNAPRFSAQ